MARKLLHTHTHTHTPLIRVKQIALAAAMVAAAGSALADVSVYGIVDANVNNSKAEAGSKPLGQLGKTLTPTDTNKKNAIDLLKPLATTVPTPAAQAGQGRIGSSGLSTSRIGFKGTEDLGGGLSASFQLEGKINVDTGENANYDGGFFGRQSWVGLSGNFGKLQLGKTWTSFDDVKGSFEHADNTNVGVTSAVWGAFGNLYDNNVANQIKYTLPSVGGLTASIGYAFGENKTGSSGTGATANPGHKADNTVSFGVKYTSGALALGYAYQTEDTNDSGANKASQSVKDRFNLIGASYDLGGAKLVGSWSDAKTTRSYSTQESNNITNAFGQVTFPTGAGANAQTEAAKFYRANSKANRYQLGVSFPVGASKLYFGYADSNEKRGGKDIGDASGYVLAATYSLSKRTTAYAGYTNVKATLNKDAVYTGQKEISGKSTKTVVGIRHVF